MLTDQDGKKIEDCSDREWYDTICFDLFEIEEVDGVRKLILTDMTQNRGFSEVSFITRYNEHPLLCQIRDQCFNLEEAQRLLLTHAIFVAIKDDNNWVVINDDPDSNPIAICRKDIYDARVGLHWRNACDNIVKQMEKFEHDLRSDEQAFCDAVGIPELGPSSDNRKTAGKIVAGLWDLAGDKAKIAWENLYKLVREPDANIKRFGLVILQQELRLNVASLFITQLRQADQRASELLRLMKRLAPGNTKSLGYLRRIARAFIFGLDTECMILCRAVVDQELQSHVSSDDCVSVCGPSQRPYTLEQRLETALAKGLLTNNSKDLADEVRTNGNKAAHESPFYFRQADAIKSIKNCLTIVEELNK